MITRPGDKGWSLSVQGFWIPPRPELLPPGSYIEMPCSRCDGKGIVSFLFWKKPCKKCGGKGVLLYGPSQQWQRA